ncbi:sulfite exporter TauE/SafE family protein [Alteromonas sp. 14N.309.X.WAT.G.H12]|uniref:sulfite exporter TauE/SafE family protein n=1 Tax=Alteromonas sp. 14N.309.X.WAT.G.H12 TaxID=3120824 RepID=UPI002FD005A8
MNDLSFLSAFLVGLAGGIHCLGMCGGIVVAFSTASSSNYPKWSYALAYNFGRICSYILAGAITGTIGQMATQWIPLSGPVLGIFSGLMLIAMACYLGNWWHGLLKIEASGKRLWQLIQPFSKRFFPFKTPLYAVPYGMVWGWLPCGLVYSTLTWALASGSTRNGAIIMAGFGLGTLPTLLAASAGAHWLTQGFKRPILRQILAVSLLLYASLLIWRTLSTLY